MGLTRIGAVRARRVLAVAACLGLAATGALTLAIPSAIGSSAAAAAPFDPYSVTFVSLERGWALGTAPCALAAHCIALRETTDAGRSWFVRPAEPRPTARWEEPQPTSTAIPPRS